MKFLVQFQLEPKSKNAIVEAFEKRGPNRILGVSFRGAWVATQSDTVFALGESEDEALLKEACEAWKNFGTYEIHPVVDIEQF